MHQARASLTLPSGYLLSGQEDEMTGIGGANWRDFPEGTCHSLDFKRERGMKERSIPVGLP